MTSFQTAALGSQGIAEIIAGQSPPSSSYNDHGSGLPFYQGKADFGTQYPLPTLYSTEGRQVANPGDVLLAVRAPVGDVNIAQGQCVIGRGLAAIRPGPKVDPLFLFFALMYARPQLRVRATGSTFESVNRAAISEVEIPLPERKTQKKISGVLQFVLDSQAGATKLLDVLASARRTATQRLFTRGLRGNAQKETEVGPIPQDWNISTIGEHFSVVSGGTPSRANPMYWEGGTIPWVKTAEVSYNVITDSEERITDVALAESAAKLLPAGTLLMAMYGQGVTRGKVAILGIDASCNQACAAMLPLGDLVLTRFLYHFLAYRYEEIRRLSHGGQQQNLNLEIVRDLHLVIPDQVTEQHEIADILDALDASMRLHEQKRSLLKGLFESLLNDLMTGEIDVNDLDLSSLEVAA